MKVWRLECYRKDDDMGGGFFYALTREECVRHACEKGFVLPWHPEADFIEDDILEVEEFACTKDNVVRLLNKWASHMDFHAPTH